jgi:hypothetical protein
VELPDFVATALAYITGPSSQLSSSLPASSCVISDFFSTYEKDLEDRMTLEHRQMVQQLFDEIHSTDIYRTIGAMASTDDSTTSSDPACCRVSGGHEGGEPETATSPGTIPGELATLILFLLLRQLDETMHHQEATLLPCSSHASLEPQQQQQQPAGCPKGGERGCAGQPVRFGESVTAALSQLDALPLVNSEVGYLWASFRNIAFFCACRDRRTPCH